LASTCAFECSWPSIKDNRDRLTGGLGGDGQADGLDADVESVGSGAGVEDGNKLYEEKIKGEKRKK
jgi:hypothetical protein